jgi:hypothetical protein
MVIKEYGDITFLWQTYTSSEIVYDLKNLYKSSIRTDLQILKILEEPHGENVV